MQDVRFDEQTLQVISEMASALMAPKQIALLCGIPWQSFLQALQDDTSELYQAYHKGKLKTIYTIRKAEVELAKMSSPMAVEQAERYIEQMNIEEIE